MSAVSGAFGGNGYLSAGRKQTFNTYFHGLPLGIGGVYYLEYESDMLVSWNVTVGSLLLSIPVAGQASVSVDSRVFKSTTSCAALAQSGQRLEMVIENGARHIVLRVNSSAFQGALRRMLDREPAEPVFFEPEVDLTTVANWALLRIITTMIEAIDAADQLTGLAMQSFESLIVGQLLLGQPNNYSRELFGESGSPKSPAIARAEDVIRANLGEPLTVDDIARGAGLSKRALQTGFRRAHGTTPMAFLREARLQRVRTELLGADPTNTSVTNIALKWGFQHLGRFAVAYHRRFGEAPSQTLRFRANQANELS
ncbi:AraC family transcriptional regulator [Paraburkholderia sediminicola]|nr:AraC family transcriptional regulator [Paraburkholderia sediminicola]